MYDSINSSNHSIILLSFKFILIVRISTSQNGSIINSNCLWDKTRIEDIANYNHVLNRLLSNTHLDCELFTCSNCNCSLDIHQRGIDKSHNFIIQSCLSASEKCIPMATTGARMEGSGKT